MSDRHFWQLYGLTMCAVLWLIVASHAWRTRRRRNRLLRCFVCGEAPHHSTRRNGVQAVP